MRQFVPLLIAIVLTACEQAGTVPLAEFERKSREVDSLRAVIDDLQNGPPRLLARAKTALDEKNFPLAKNIAQQLSNRFPEAPEAREGKRILADAEAGAAAAAAARRREIERALGGMIKKRDEMRGLTFWRDRATPAYVNSRSWVGAYIVESDGRAPTLRMTIYYKAEDWLFIERYLAKVDGKDYRFVPDDFGADAVERDNGSGDIWEWWDVVAEGERLAFLRTLAEATSATIRYDGKQYYRDRSIGTAERDALKRTLVAYDALIERSR